MIDPELDIPNDCDIVEELYEEASIVIENFNDSFLNMTLKAHKELIESRTDWEKCEKTVRRKRIIAMLHNTIVKEKNI